MEVDGSQVELPIYLTARRLLDRHQEQAVEWYEDSTRVIRN